MAGRGRGRTMFPLSVDPGLKVEPTIAVLVPPPNYPMLEYKPTPMTYNIDTRYQLHLKKYYAEYMFDSTNNVQPKFVKKDIDRYCDRYREPQNQFNVDEYDWSSMPNELKPSIKRKGKALNGSLAKKKYDVDIKIKLEELEKMEKNLNDEDDEKVDKDDDENDDEDKEGDEEGSDMEMDEGTDYMKDYYETGENYEDEEDNGDESLNIF